MGSTFFLKGQEKAGWRQRSQERRVSGNPRKSWLFICVQCPFRTLVSYWNRVSGSALPSACGGPTVSTCGHQSQTASPWDEGLAYGVRTGWQDHTCVGGVPRTSRRGNPLPCPPRPARAREDTVFSWAPWRIDESGDRSAMLAAPLSRKASAHLLGTP